MKRALLVLAAFWLLAAYPGGVFPGRASGGNSGGGVNPAAISLSITLDDDSAPAPVSPVITVRVVGYFGSGNFHYTCSATDTERITPTTFGTEVVGGTQYILDTVCGPYTTADDYLITVWLERAGVTYDDTATLTVEANPGQVRIAQVVALDPICTLPCADQVMVGFAYNGTTSYTWKHDADESCPSSTTVCSDACWTTMDTGGFMDAGTLPDFAGTGIKVVRTCVLDEVPSSAHYQVQFEALSSSAALEITAVGVPATSAGPTLDDVALEVDCTGGTCAQGCDVTFDCDKDTLGSSPSSLYTNSFATTGAAGCDDLTSITGTGTCAAGTAQVGTGGATTNAIFFHNQYVSAVEQFVDVEDMTIITDSSNVNQNRLNLRDDANNKYIWQTANPVTNTGRLTCPGPSSCTTPLPMYTDGVAFDFTIHVENTATGRASILDAAGETLCTCSGGAAGEVDGFVLNGGQAVVSFGAVNVRVPGVVSSDPTAVIANTTWPYNTEDEATENCDGYTTGTTTARVVVACPDSETIPVDIPIQVTAAPTFSITSVTPDVGAACTVPNCIVNEVTIVYAGTATGTVSAIGCSMALGAANETLTTTTDAASPFAIASGGGWAGGYSYEDPGTYTITCTATREGVTATKAVQLQVSEEVVPVTDLVIDPTMTTRFATVGGNPTADQVCLKDAAGGALAFTCTETDPSSIITPSAVTGTTPACITRTYTTSTKTAGIYREFLNCAADDNATDTAIAQVDVNVSAPVPIGTDPSWFIGRDSSDRPLIASGNGLGTLTMHRRDKRITPTMQNLAGAGMKQYDDDFINSYSENGLVYSSTFDRKNGQPSSVDCVPLTECGTLPDGSGPGKSDPDAVHFWADIKYNALLVVGNWFKNAIFRNTTCTSSGNCPHCDLVQFYTAGGCPGAHTSFINNRFGADPARGEEQGDGGADSGQQMHATTWRDRAPTCDVKTFLLQGNVAVQDPGTGCTDRGADSYTGTRACGKLHFQIPAVSVAGDAWSLWCIQNEGITLKGGGTATPILSSMRIVKVGTCPTTQIIGNPTIVTYPNIEAAKTAEAALGQSIPVGMEISCKGWATPPAGCSNVAGDPD
jgi:hypothetical protein